LYNVHEKTDLTEKIQMATDKRIIKTKISIKTAFMQLMTEKKIDKITVSDVAAKAMVNRSTFYLHYSCVDAVKKDIEKEIAVYIAEDINKVDVSDIYGSVYELFVNMTARLDKETTLKKYIIFSKDSYRIIDRLKEILVEKTADAMLETFPNLTVEQLKYPLTFAAAGIVDSYVKWVRFEKDGKTLEELIGEVSNLTNRIIEELTSDN